MKTQRIICFSALCSAIFALFLIGLAAAYSAATPASLQGNTGQALMLRSVLDGRRAKTFAQAARQSSLPKSTNGRSAHPFAGGSDPVTLVPYDSREVIHVTNALGKVVRNADIPPGQPVTFTVRVNNSQAATQATSVYIQIKDPDSQYQDAQGREHKVFTKDGFDFNRKQGQDSGAASAVLYNGSLGNAVQTFTVRGRPFDFIQRGAVGGYDASYISVGHVTPPGGTNPVLVDVTNNGVTTHVPLPGPDPANFFVWGQEYECQYVDAHNSTAGYAGGDTTDSDYGTPYYLAGYDDQQRGSARPPRAEWLQLTKNPGNGDLYTAVWTSPTSPSDYYLDAIVYDDAPSFRIFDNVWGFSTNTFAGSQDILVVNDNALGQKFGASGLPSQGLINLRPLFYGAESYFTDVSSSLLPNSVYFNIQPTGQNPTDKNGKALDDQIPVPVVSFLRAAPGSQSFSALNGLGRSSYSDSVTQRENNNSQQYSQWRILSRGAVPASVLQMYAPTFVSQPAVNDPQTGFTAPAADGNAVAKIPVAKRCVIWVSPFTGDLPLSVTGSLADQDTQKNLRNFVNVGGRLFVTGQDVAASVTGSGQPDLNGPGSFVYDVLNAQLVSPTDGSQILAGDVGIGNRISFDAFFNFLAPPQFDSVYSNFLEFVPTGPYFFVYKSPAESPLLLGNNFREVIGSEPLWRTDGALTQLGPVVTSIGSSIIQGQIDTVSAQNGANTDITTGGAPGLIYHEDLSSNFGKGYGSRVVFASFGLEGLGIEYYKKNFENRDLYFPRNQRPNILHNIVSYLRTGTFTGRIFQGTGSNKGVAGATVYLVPFRNVAFPGVRQVFSGLTDADGNYRIEGVEPGAYITVAYRTGFTRDRSPTFNFNALRYSVAGDTTASNINLNIVPLPPGSISGKVVDGANGKGIPGATVVFNSDDGAATVTGTTDANGNYKIINVPVGTYTGKAMKRPQYDDSATATVKVDTAKNTVQNFTLNAGTGTISGRVFNTLTGGGISGATVTFDNGETTFQVTTDANGNYISDPLPTGTTGTTTYTLTATAVGYETNTIQVTLKQNDKLRGKDIGLRPLQSGSVGGLVVDSFTGKPVGGATVTFTNPDNGFAQTFTTSGTTTSPGAPSGDGKPLNYGPGMLLEGTYTVTVTKTNYAPVTRTGVVVRPGIFNRVDFTGVNALPSLLGTVGGLVTNTANGQPLAGVTITVDNATTGANVLTLQTTGTATSPGVPSGDGKPLNYGPTSLLQGTYKVTATRFGFATQTKTITVTPNRLNRADFALASTLGTVGGLVTDPFTGLPLGGAIVTIIDANGVTAATVTTSATVSRPVAPNGDGKPLNYSARVPAGVYSIRVTKSGYGTANRNGVTVGVAQFTRADFTGTSGPQRMTALLGGLVTDAVSGKPLAGATVTVTEVGNGNVVAGPFPTSGTTFNAPAPPVGDGRPVNYEGGVPEGEFNVTVSKTGFISQTKRKIFQKNLFARVDFTGTGALQPLHIFPRGYNFFSVPYDYSNFGPTFFNTLFGPLNTGTSASPSAGGNRSRIAVWNPVLVQYVLDPTSPADALRPGQGYWVFLQKPVGLTVAGEAPTSPVSKSLIPDWNMIGVPSTRPIDLSGANGLKFANPNGAPLTFEQATSSAYNLVDKTLYRYVPGLGGGYKAVVAGEKLQPYQAYWIRAIVRTTVQIPIK